MKKLTKGALGATAAGALLLGGAGSLAFWTDGTTVDGGSISSGSIDLSNVTCAAAWTHTETSTAVTKIVPGDTISKLCTGTLTLVGDHIGATVDLDADSLDAVSGDLGAALDASATLVDPAGGAVTTQGAHDVTVRIDVTFPTTVTSVTTQNATATLDALQLTATQTHE